MPRVSTFKAHGIHDGINGGRRCRVIAGTYCDGQEQGTCVEKVKGCSGCEFLHIVFQEEGWGMVSIAEILKKIS